MSANGEHGWPVVAASFALLFAGFGVVYAFGVFFLPLEQAFNGSRANVSAVFAYAAALIFITGAISGRLADHYGAPRIVACGLVGIIAGLVGSALAPNLGTVTAAFTCGVGIGVGFVYVPCLGAVQRSFTPQRRALASGVAVTGIGVGTLAMPLIAGMAVEMFAWRGALALLAALVALLGVPAVLVLATKSIASPPALFASTTGTGGDEGAAWLKLVSGRPFVQLYLAQCAMSFVVMLPFVHLVPSAVDSGITLARAVTLLSLVGIGSTLGRIVIGAVADRLGRAHTLVGLFVASSGAFGLWVAASSYAAFTAFALGWGVVYGGFIALMPALLADYFAGPRLSSIIGLQYTSAAFGSLLGPLAAGYIFDVTGSYKGALTAAALACMLAAVLLATTPAPAVQRAGTEGR